MTWPGPDGGPGLGAVRGAQSWAPAILLAHLAVLAAAVVLSGGPLVTGVVTGTHTTDGEGVVTCSGPAPLLVSLLRWAGAFGLLIGVLVLVGRRRRRPGLRLASGTAAWLVVPCVWVGLPGAGEHPEVAVPLYLLLGVYFSFLLVPSALVGAAVMVVLGQRARCPPVLALAWVECQTRAGTRHTRVPIRSER